MVVATAPVAFYNSLPGKAENLVLPARDCSHWPPSIVDLVMNSTAHELWCSLFGLSLLIISVHRSWKTVKICPRPFFPSTFSFGVSAQSLGPLCVGTWSVTIVVSGCTADLSGTALKSQLESDYIIEHFCLKNKSDIVMFLLIVLFSVRIVFALLGAIELF